MIMSIMRIALSFLLFLSCSVSADTYDHLLLRAQASIFPKIVLLDQGLNKKTPDDEIVLNIVSSKRDAYIAQQLKKSIEDKYGSSLGNKKLTVSITTFEEFNETTLATAYIVLQSSESLIKKVVAYASRHERIVFSYSYSNFIYDALISLHVKEKAYVYLNKSAIQLYGIEFLPVFYKITKII